MKPCSRNQCAVRVVSTNNCLIPFSCAFFQENLKSDCLDSICGMPDVPLQAISAEGISFFKVESGKAPHRREWYRHVQ